MKKWIDQLRTLLNDFIDQRDDLMLLLACPPGESALMLNLLLGMERDKEANLYYLFADDFASSPAYIDAIAHRLKRDYDASVESTPDVDPLPPISAQCLKTSETPIARLHAALAYTRSLIPASTGHRIVWGFGPSDIGKVEDYAALLMGCLPNPAIEPWMRGLRMIVRVPEDYPATAALAKGPRVRYQRFVIPPDAAESELRATSQNAKLPDAARIEALLQLSFIDLAHGRLQPAAAGLREALAHYQKAEDPSMQALAMIGLGDISRRANDIDKAKYWYECAIAPAGEGKQLISLSMIAQHLGAIAFERKQYEDAVAYYEQLVILMRAIPNEDGLCESLIWQGKAQDKAGQVDAALASWEEAIMICQAFELDHRKDDCLTQLRRGYEAVGKRSEGEKVIQECKNVKPRRVRGSRAIVTKKARGPRTLQGGGGLPCHAWKAWEKRWASARIRRSLRRRQRIRMSQNRRRIPSASWRTTPRKRPRRRRPCRRWQASSLILEAHSKSLPRARR
jgi:tetratricopeptide (TPR) repeat protein